MAEKKAAKARDTFTGTLVVDASSWIRLYDEHYQIGTFPSLWTKLKELGTAGRFKVPREVLREVGEKDGVGAWLRTIKPAVTVNPTTKVIARAKALAKAYPALIAKNAAAADPWIIAIAEAGGDDHVVVTEEAPGGKSKMKIPDVCAELDVVSVRTPKMLEMLGVKICAKCL